MAKVQKYLFDLDFDAPPPRQDEEIELDTDIEMMVEPPVEEPPPPPTFSEEELALARDQAYELGRQAGIAEAEAARERLLAMAMSSLVQQLRDLAATQEAANDSLMRDAVSVAMAVVRKVLPEVSRHHALDEIAAVVQECLGHIEKDVRVTIRVNPDHVDHIRQHANDIAEATGFEGKLVYAGDPRIAVGDCRVEWGDGGAERDQTRLWADIDAVISRALGEPQASAVGA